MISKVILGKSFAGCCRYVQLKKGAEVLIANGVRTENPKETATDFEMIRELRPKLKTVVIHASVSFAHEDKPRIDNRLMIDVANRFMSKLGMEDGQYICVRHKDAAHDHFHIIANRVKYDGSVLPDSFLKNRAAKTCDELELEFSLTIARGHGIGAKIKDRNPKKSLIKESIRLSIEEGISNGINDFDLLNEHLKSKGIEMHIQYQSTGRINGLSFRKDSISFKGSSIDRKFSYKKFERVFDQNHINNQVKGTIKQTKPIKHER